MPWSPVRSAAATGAVGGHAARTPAKPGRPATTMRRRQRCAAMRAHPKPLGYRSARGHEVSGGRRTAQQLSRRAADRPAVADHLARQGGRRANQRPRRYRGRGSGQQAIHVHRTTAGQTVQQLRGGQAGLIGAILGIPGVLDQLLDAIERVWPPGLIGQRQPGQRSGEPRRRPGEPHVLRGQRRPHAVPAKCSRPVQQRQPGRTVHPAHPPGRALPPGRGW